MFPDKVHLLPKDPVSRAKARAVALQVLIQMPYFLFHSINLITSFIHCRFFWVLILRICIADLRWDSASAESASYQISEPRRVREGAKGEWLVSEHRSEERMWTLLLSPWSFKWAAHWIADGLTDLEGLLKQTSGKFAVGDDFSVADLCIPSIVYNAKRSAFHLLCTTEINRS